MPWVVLDMSVNINWTSRTGRVPLGVNTQCWLTPMSPIVTSNGSCPAELPYTGSVILPPRQPAPPADRDILA